MSSTRSSKPETGTAGDVSIRRVLTGLGTSRVERESLKVFISWSGPRSRVVAAALRDWLQNVVYGANPFMSEVDIEKGTVGWEVIEAQLDESTFGIVCLTADNHVREWINYEAGALAKAVGKDRNKVATLLIDIPNRSAITGPLGVYQDTQLRDKEDMRKLIRSIAAAAGDVRGTAILDKAFDALWPQFEDAVTTEKLDAAAAPSSEPVRDAADMFAELVERMRQVSRDVSHSLTARSAARSESTPQGRISLIRPPGGAFASVHTEIIGSASPSRGEAFPDTIHLFEQAMMTVLQRERLVAALDATIWSPDNPFALFVAMVGDFPEQVTAEIVEAARGFGLALTIKRVNVGDTVLWGTQTYSVGSRIATTGAAGHTELGGGVG